MTLADNGWTPASEPSSEDAWFFGILSLTAPGHSCTVSRTFPAEPGTQRGAVYAWLRREATVAHGIWADGADVLCFDVGRREIL